MTMQSNSRPHRYRVRGVATWGAVQCFQIDLTVEAYGPRHASRKALAFHDDCADWDADVPPEVTDLGEIPEDEWMWRIGQRNCRCEDDGVNNA